MRAPNSLQISNDPANRYNHNVCLLLFLELPDLSLRITGLDFFSSSSPYSRCSLCPIIFTNSISNTDTVGHLQAHPHLLPPQAPRDSSHASSSRYSKRKISLESRAGLWVTMSSNGRSCL